MKFDTSVLVLSHSNYLVTDAGVEKIIQGQQEIFLRNQVNFIVVYPIRKDIKTLSGVHSVTTAKYGLIINGKEQPEIDEAGFWGLLDTRGLKALMIHELVTFSKNEKLFTFFDRVTCPIYYFVHDYAMVCYSHTLMRNNREFCGKEPVSFKKCCECRYYLQGKKNASWQQKFVRKYKNIVYIFPSTVVQSIWQKTFQVDNRQLIVPNTKFGPGLCGYEKKPENEKLRIAFIGYGRVEKGWETWKKLCKQYDETYELYVLGDGECEGNIQKIPVSVAKDGPNAMIDAIRKHRIDIAFLWSTCAETYSYTFFESYVSGCYILTNNKSGNICSMTRQYRCGQVLESEEALFAYLDNEALVKGDIERMQKEISEHPVSLENNDEILWLIKGEKS